jgi:hypothetical protein
MFPETQGNFNPEHEPDLKSATGARAHAAMILDDVQTF